MKTTVFLKKKALLEKKKETSTSNVIPYRYILFFDIIRLRKLIKQEGNTRKEIVREEIVYFGREEE